MRLSPVVLLLVSIVFPSVMITPAVSQTGTVSTVRISGRLISPDGKPVSFGVQLSRSDDRGIEKTATAGADGSFSFIIKAGQKYRVSLGPGMKTPSKVVNTASGTDIDVGEMVFEQCPFSGFTRSPTPPVTAAMTGSLTLDQIVIDPQQLPPTGMYLRWIDVAPPVSAYKYVEPPECWSGYASANHRAEWEGVGSGFLKFDRYISVEEFIGGKVRSIHVIRHDPKLTPDEIRDEVRKVWLGVFWSAHSMMVWSEPTEWNIAASVEFEDGKWTSLVMDGQIHVRVHDRAGNGWFIRLWPALD